MDFLKNNLFHESIRGFIATFIMGLGITLFIECELGSDPVSVFLDGVNRKTGLSISLIDQVLNIVLLVLAVLVNKKNVGISTIINVLVLGICIEIPTQIISPFSIETKSLWIRFIFLIIGQLCFAFSIAWMQTFKSGMSTLDVIFYRIMKITHMKYRTIRIIYDSTYLIIGYSLGGIIGIGTILSLVSTGVLTEKFLKLIKTEKQKGEQSWMKQQYNQQ